MSRDAFENYARRATRSIDHRADRDAAREELIDHLDTRFGELVDAGLPEDLAERTALEAMGEPQELIIGLEHANRPPVTSRIVIAILVIAVLALTGIYLAFAIPIWLMGW